MHGIVFKDRMMMDAEVVREFEKVYKENAKDFLVTNVARKGLVLITGREFTPMPTSSGKFRLLPGRFVVPDGDHWAIGHVPNEVLEITVPLNGTKYNVWIGADTRQNGKGTASVSGTAVTGTDTEFTKEYRKNQYIAFEGDTQAYYKIASVDSDTAITLVAGPASAITDEMHYLSASFYEDTPSGADSVYIRQRPYYSVTLETNLNQLYDDMVLVAQVRTDAATGVVELIKDFRWDSQFMRVPLGEELQFKPAKPLNVTLETGIYDARRGLAWVKVKCGWSGDSCTPSTLSVDISAAGYTFTTDQLVDQYFEDSTGATFLITANNTDGSSITLDGTPQSGEWKIHPNALQYDVYTRIEAYPPPHEGGTQVPVPTGQEIDRVDTGGVSFSPTKPEILVDCILGAQYLFKLRSNNGPNKKSDWSAYGTFNGQNFIDAGYSTAVAAAPTGGTISNYNEADSTFTVTFNTVTQDTDGNPITPLSYQVATTVAYDNYENPTFYPPTWPKSNNHNILPTDGSSTFSVTFVVTKKVVGPEGTTVLKYVSATARAIGPDNRPGEVSTRAETTLQADVIQLGTTDTDTGGGDNAGA